MISHGLIGLVRCPDCLGALVLTAPSAVCQQCGRQFQSGGGFLDLRPLTAFEEQTKYLDEALHADARHESIAPPLLGSKIRNDMLRRFLKPGPGDRVLDLGCGSGRTLTWNRESGAALTGIDIAPYFAPEAVETSDLLLGDLRRLPIKDGTFSKAWSLDVLEHLSRPALIEMLSQANRVLAPGGALFVYTHVRKNGWPAVGVRMVNRLARVLERLGLLDLRQERLRKSDHVNPLADHDDLARVAAESGFRIERITYYTPVVGAFVENVLARMAERFLARRAVRKAPTGAGDEQAGIREARTSAQARVRRRGPLYWGLMTLSTVMKIDVVLFGRVRSGPFFALLRKTGA
ncbi:MAG TPA: methyltransferase domain-containing protein [Vicinamibacterales bacterium]|nr:methyltransferase domain-containing protein [Vicinamibacterales bacterium]